MGNKIEYALVTDSRPTAVKVNQTLERERISYTYTECLGLFCHRIHNKNLEQLARLVNSLQTQGIPVSVQVHGNSLEG